MGRWSRSHGPHLNGTVRYAGRGEQGATPIAPANNRCITGGARGDLARAGWVRLSAVSERGPLDCSKATPVDYLLTTEYVTYWSVCRLHGIFAEENCVLRIFEYARSCGLRCVLQISYCIF